MTTATGCAMAGSLFVLCGLAGVLWRFSKQPHRANGALPTWRPPGYLAGCALVVVGLILLVAAFVLVESGNDPAPVAVYLAGFAVGLCLAVPGVITFVRSLPAVKRWSKTRQSINPPWAAQLGVAMIVLGVVAGGVVAPTIILALR